MKKFLSLSAFYFAYSKTMGYSDNSYETSSYENKEAAPAYGNDDSYGKSTYDDGHKSYKKPIYKSYKEKKCYYTPSSLIPSTFTADSIIWSQYTGSIYVKEKCTPS